MTTPAAPSPSPGAARRPAPPRDWGVALLRLLMRPCSDALYLKVAHRNYFGRWPNFRQPGSLHEHIQSYVLRNRDPRLVMLADKVRVRDYIERSIGPEYVVPLLNTWKRAEDVPLRALPFPVVLKPSHASGRVLLLRTAADVRPDEHLRLLRKWLLQDYSRVNREWFYRHVPRRIVAEPMLFDADGGIPADYKAYVIGGRVRYFQVEKGRFQRATRNLYAPDWQLLPVRGSQPRHPPEPAPPELPQMVELAELLAAPFEFMRVDFYLTRHGLRISELTNSPGAGFGRFYPEAFGVEMGGHWSAAGSASAP
jgi:hypothetical protein